MTWLSPLYCIGVLLGVVVTLLVLVFALVVVGVHWLSLALCAIGLHRVGCWIRRNMTLPVLEQLSRQAHELHKLARKKSGL